jgi:uncharacterized membrane protein
VLSFTDQEESTMIPVIALLLGTLTARLAGFAGVDALDNWQPSVRAGLAAMLLLTGSAHWGKRRPDLIAMVPERFPRPGLLVSLTGALEIAGAAGLMITRTAPYAAVGLALLFLAMFPANISAARRQLTLNRQPVTPLPQRTAMQALFLTAAVAAAV